MRARLTWVLLTLMACILLALGVPLATSILREHQNALFQDRVDDTSHFAALAESALPGPPPAALGAELTRYHQVYGISAAVVGRDGRPWIATDGYPGNRSSDVGVALRQAYAGRHSADAGTIWPWSHRTLTVTAPVMQSGDVVGAVVTVSPTGRMRTAVLYGWLLLCSAEAVALLACLMLAHVLATWMLRPIEALDAVTHTISTGRLGARVATAGGPPELRRLGTSFNEMVERVESAMERQRAFVADASHQLRNPLSAVMLRLEELAMTLPPGREEELDGVRQEAHRLTRVLEDILELALAEEGSATVEEIDLTVLIEERVAAWQVVADHRAIEVLRMWDGPVLGSADATGLGSAFDAVIDNALKFSPSGSAVRVEVSETGHGAEIRVTDQGAGLPPEELARIGDRFWRSPRHQNVDGSGLGLAVARTLLTAGGGRLDVTAGAGGGLVVTMTIAAEPPPVVTV
ncbi:MAG TPA: HAMP domain-containing sensor histidine kinase [Actinomadura sp.]|nr:HAMP domain-containing sensor histidine kinase [Actinomadura sp.]